MEREFSKANSNSGHENDSQSLFKNKNKIFKKMQTIIAECQKTTSIYTVCPSFSGMESFSQSIHQQMSIESPQTENQKDDKQYSKDHRERKELYIQFLEKKIYELLDHIYFIQRTQEQIAKQLYFSFISFAEKLEVERSLIKSWFKQNIDDPQTGFYDERWRSFEGFDEKQLCLKKNIVQNTIKTLIDYSVPRLLHYMAGALNVDMNDSLILSTKNKDFDHVSLKNEIWSQKENSDKILFDILHLRNKIFNQWTSFGIVSKKIINKRNVHAASLFEKLIDIEDPKINFSDCQFIDEKTKSILRYFEPICA